MKKRKVLLVIVLLYFIDQNSRADGYPVDADIRYKNLLLLQQPVEKDKQTDIAIIFFLALIPVLIAFIFIIFILYRQKREAHFRHIQLQLELDKSELEMRALRAQVNPHFVFNCLNSIQYFMHKNDSKLAESYLVKFSRLIRLVLENSTYPMVHIREDLDALELYIQMEQLRLNHSFAYQIDIQNIAVEQVRIPPLLIQPFVENAIWHGLTHLRKGGLINIKLSLINNELRCIIEDNGIAKPQKFNQNMKSKSMGLDLIKQRLNLLEKIHETTCSFTIQDRYDEAQRPAGKKISILLPHKQ